MHLDLVKAFGYSVNGIKFFFVKRPCLHLTCATRNEQPCNIKTMVSNRGNLDYGLAYSLKKGGGVIFRVINYFFLFSFITAYNGTIRCQKWLTLTFHISVTLCQRSSDPFHTVTYYIKWVGTSWIHIINKYIDKYVYFVFFGVQYKTEAGNANWNVIDTR